MRPPEDGPSFADRAAMAAAALQRLSEGRFPNEDIPTLRMALEQLLVELLPGTHTWVHLRLQSALNKTASTTAPR